MASNRRTGQTGVSATGRGSKLTPEVQELICQHIRGGSFKEVAAQAAGIWPDTLSQWLRYGNEDEKLGHDTIYRRFALALAQAEAQGESIGALRIRGAGAVDWRAEAWLMERRWPQRWALRQTVTVEGVSYAGELDAEFVVSDLAFDIVPKLLDGLEAKTKLLGGGQPVDNHPTESPQESGKERGS